MTPVTREVQFSEIIFNTDIYPRKEHNPALVQQYAADMEAIEAHHRFMSVSEDMELLDGRHRHLAYQKNGIGPDDTVTVLVYPTADPVEKFLLAIELNAEHGDQLTAEDKCRRVQIGYGKLGIPIAELAKRARVRYDRALEWTKSIREEEERQENETIFELWLRCYTQEQIAEATGIERSVVSRKLPVLCESFPGTIRTKLSKYDEEDWSPPLYDIWTPAKNSNAVKHYGNTCAEFVDNLIYTFTAPFDIVIDPFAGGGSTIDVCKRRLRRYWASDRVPIVEREGEIRKHDVVTDGISGPSRWADVALVYLDPPYWKQAAGKYSNDPTDLANMPLDDFTDTLVGIIHDYAAKLKPGAHIACIISPTQWLNDNHEAVYHDLDLARLVTKKLKLARRVVCPYSTEQYNGTQVNAAKEEKLWLVLSRTMLVWERV